MKNKLLYTFLFFLSIFAFLSSCTEEIEIELDSSFNRLIVYGEISTDTTAHKIRLVSSADYFFNKPAEGVSGAQVTISDGNREITLAEKPDQKGIYETPADYFGLAGKTYGLLIQNVDIDKDGVSETYSASSFLPLVAPTDSVKLNYVKYPFFQGSELQLYARDPAESIDFYAFKVSRNGILQTDSLPEISVQSDILFNGNYTNGVSVLFLDDKKPGEQVMGGDTLVFQMMGITSEYYSFIIESQTALFGSNPLFSGPPANISTNLSNGALGFFTAINIKRTKIIAPEKP